MMMTDSEFQDLTVRSKLLDTFERLGLHKTEPSWEDTIMDAYLKTLNNFGQPDGLILDPKAFETLRKSLGSKK